MPLLAQLKNLHLSSAEKDAMLALAVTASLYLPWMVSASVVVLAAFYVMADYRRRMLALQLKGARPLLVMLGVSFFVAAGYKNYVGMGMTLALVMLLVYGFYLRGIMTRRLFHKMMDAACVMSMPAIVLAVMQKAWVFSSAPEYRPVAFFFNANYFGMMIEFTVLIALYRAYTNRKSRPLYACAILLNLMGMYLCGSMSALMAMTCGVLLFLLLKRRYKILALFIGAVLAFLLCGSLIPGLIPRADAVVSTTEQRFSIWTGALKGFVETPLLGRGVQTYHIIYQQMGSYPTYHCHDIYLEALLDFGMLGTACIAYFALVQCRELYRRVRFHTSGNVNLLVLAAVAVTAIHGITDVTVFWVQTGMLFLLIFSATGIRLARRAPVWQRAGAALRTDTG